MAKAREIQKQLLKLTKERVKATAKYNKWDKKQGLKINKLEAKLSKALAKINEESAPQTVPLKAPKVKKKDRKKVKGKK